LECTYPHFPAGSIFVSVVDPSVGSKRQILAARTKQGIFLAPDNGLLTRVLEKEKKYELRSVTNRSFFLKKVSSTFHGRDCFAPTAARLARNPSLFSRVGPPLNGFTRLELPRPVRRGQKVVGEILYFDHFGNAFTNISRGLLRSKGHSFQVRVKGRSLGRVRESYYQVAPGRPVAVFSSSDLLEIALNQGSARKKLGLREGAVVEVA